MDECENCDGSGECPDCELGVDDDCITCGGTNECEACDGTGEV